MFERAAILKNASTGCRACPAGDTRSLLVLLFAPDQELAKQGIALCTIARCVVRYPA